MENLVFRELILNYGTVGLIIGTLLLIVYRLDSRLTKREARESEFRDTLVKIIDSNTRAMTELVTIIKTRKVN